MTRLKEIEKTYREELFELIKENPELEIVPMVDCEVVAGDDYSSWLGSWGEAKIDHIHIPDWNDEKKILNPERIYFKSEDEEYIKDQCFNYFESGNPSWTDDEIEGMSNKHFDGMEWKKVITVSIGLP